METAAKKLSIEISDKAVEHVSRFMEKEGAQGHVLRVGVKGGGCSGLSYVLQFEGEERINPLMDEVFGKDGIRVVVDKKSLFFPGGHHAGFRRRADGQGLYVQKPQRTPVLWLRGKFFCVTQPG
jgi:iron-sulfur cluster assembly protein